MTDVYVIAALFAMAMLGYLLGYRIGKKDALGQIHEYLRDRSHRDRDIECGRLEPPE